MRDIIHTVEVSTSPNVVDEALTTEQGLSRWWTKQVKVDGDVIRFTFEKGFNPVMRVDQHEPGKLLAWSTESAPWTGATIRFELADRDGKTGLLFRQRYAQELPDETFGIFNYNWAYYLDSLRLFCETGTGKPFSPPEG